MIGHPTCHYHMVPKVGRENKAFFSLFMARKQITSFLLTIYGKKDNLKLHLYPLEPGIKTHL